MFLQLSVSVEECMSLVRLAINQLMCFGINNVC